MAYLSEALQPRGPTSSRGPVSHPIEVSLNGSQPNEYFVKHETCTLQQQQYCYGPAGTPPGAQSQPISPPLLSGSQLDVFAAFEDDRDELLPVDAFLSATPDAWHAGRGEQHSLHHQQPYQQQHQHLQHAHCQQQHLSHHHYYPQPQQTRPCSSNSTPPQLGSWPLRPPGLPPAEGGGSGSGWEQAAVDQYAAYHCAPHPQQYQPALERAAAASAAAAAAAAAAGHGLQPLSAWGAPGVGHHSYGWLGQPGQHQPYQHPPHMGSSSCCMPGEAGGAAAGPPPAAASHQPGDDASPNSNSAAMADVAALAAAEATAATGAAAPRAPGRLKRPSEVQLHPSQPADAGYSPQGGVGSSCCAVLQLDKSMSCDMMSKSGSDGAGSFSAGASRGGRPSRRSEAAAAAPMAAGAATGGASRRSSSLDGASPDHNGRAAAAALAASDHQKRRSSSKTQPPSRVKQHRQELEAWKEQVSALQSSQDETRQRLDALRIDNTDLLTRLGDVTNRWQASVSDNARLNQELSQLQHEVAHLQHQLAMCQQQLQLAQQQGQPKQPE